MSWVYLALFVFGLTMGSFLNVVADRYDQTRSFFSWRKVAGRSRCPHCGTTLRWYELVPILSFIFLRGRCRTCGSRISWQYPLAEILAGTATAGIVYKLAEMFYVRQVFLSGGPMAWFIIAAVIWLWIFYFFITLSFIDWRLKIIPNEINGLLAAAGMGLAIWQWWYGKWGLAEGTFLGGYAAMLGGRGEVFTNHLAAGVAAFAVFWIIAAVTKGRGMGMGDAKLAGALGLIFGWPDVLLIIILAFILGAAVGIYLLAQGRHGMDSQIPFGPFLVMAAATVFFWGEAILNAYFGWFGLMP